ncbi:MAG TPA: sugar ABC transporter substrate-binding protein [Rectinema sp.]|jgi:multiple sugar transport system substrate-binding protein|nr:sugar ABC transporter substrate-binding protein [Treponema sp.]OQB98963.1 MAG: Maltose-binding periplasmic protein precursor [Spirochaetes bacterium ADurb.Bin110]HPN03826.1 sugar ABC transporter substrate-binding protein [Rectinema sp.]HPW47463.1 sugar ABC transporter substrate-binding protein [Rectinema sp.]HQB07317.1 sugar ABC transporter substrate-binding protein [Rectinema sp.]
MRKIIAAFMCLGLIFAASAQKKQVIRFATWDSEETLDIQQRIVDQFNAKNPDLQVVLEAYGDDFDTKLATGFGAGDAPDVMYMWNYAHYKDGLEPLDGWVSKEPASFKADFYRGLFEYNSIGGKLLGLPIGYTTHVVYYNKDLFDKAGVPYPKGDWTWDELLATAKKVTDPSKKIYGFAFQQEPDPYDFEHYLWNVGVSYLGAEGSFKNGFKDAKVVALLTKMQNAIKEGYVISVEGSGSREMRTGKLAMFINGSWSIPSLKEANVNFGLAKMPSVEKGKKSISAISISGIAMYNKSKNKDAAWRFMKFWVSPEANTMRLDHELPVLHSVVEKEKLATDPMKAVFYEMLEQSEGWVSTSYKSKDWATLSDTISQSLQQIFNPSILASPAKVLDGLK